MTRAIPASAFKGRNKYRAEPVVIDGHRFASKKEAAHFLLLKARQQAGEISGLELQPRYELTVKGVKVGRYTADFAYFEGNERIVADVKSKPTKTEAYSLRIRLFKALYPGVRIVEV